MPEKKMSYNKQLLIAIIGVALFFIALYVFLLIYQRPFPIIPTGHDVQVLRIGYGYDVNSFDEEDITELIDHDALVEILSRYYFRRSLSGINTRGPAQWSIFFRYSQPGRLGRWGLRDVHVGGDDLSNVVDARRRGFSAIDNWESLLEELDALLDERTEDYDSINPGQIFAINADDVARIQVASGSTGERVQIEDRGEIAGIVEDMNDMRYSKREALPGVMLGFFLRISLF